MLDALIRKEMLNRTGYVIVRKDDWRCQLKPTDGVGRTIWLTLEFIKLDRMPECGDVLYFSEHLAEGLRENLFSYCFSAEIGNTCAREPHDFAINPCEFLIIAYADGTTALLEQQYG